MNRKELSDIMSENVESAIIKTSIYKIVKSHLIKNKKIINDEKIINVINNLDDRFIKMAINNKNNGDAYNLCIKNICKIILEKILYYD
jgi:hypothetical protein